MTDRERLTTDKRKIFARESLTIMSMNKDELRKHYNEIFDRLQEYEVAEEQGQLIRPPYEIGAKVYATIGSLSLPIPYAVYEVTIQRYVLVTGGLVPVVKLKKGAVTYGDIHTSIDRMYDTREEAEKALKGGGSDA